MINRHYLLFLFGLLLGLACKTSNSEEHVHAENHLGDISIEISGAASAQESFKEGLLLLHSFEYEDAAEKFRQAQEHDSTCAMAYWGEAMTYNHPLWREQNTQQAIATLQAFGPDSASRAAAIQTEFEQDLFHSAEVLFTSDPDKKQRDKNYSTYLAHLHEKYPNNHEVRSLYALSLLGSVKQRDPEQYELGAKVAQGIIAENPNHPGALHYLIHSYDDPENAPKALFAANAYAKVAPDAGHALHMPSHIYVAMGMWDEVVASNIASWEAGITRQQRKALDNDALNYHAFKWLSYAYLQRGELEESRKCLAKMKDYCSELSSNRAKSHLVQMKGAYFTETGEWEDPLLTDTFDFQELSISNLATDFLLKGMKALQDNDLKQLNQCIESLSRSRFEAGKAAQAGSALMCAGRYDQKYSTPTEVKRAHVVEYELRALSADAEGKLEMAEDYFRQATALEEETTFQFGPPEIVKPSHELYGEWLLAQGRAPEAKVQFENVLKRAPNRRLAAEGIKRCESI